MNKNNDKKSINSIFSIVIVSIVAILFIAILIQRVRIKLDNDTISISGGLFYSEKLAYSDITSLELRDSVNYGSRTNGAELFNFKLGYFENNEFGKYKLFVNSSIEKFIVLRHGEKVVVFNCKNLQDTTNLFNSLLEKTGL